MKYLNMKASKFLMLISLVMLFGACQSPLKLFNATKKIKVKSDPEVMEVHGDTMAIHFKGTFPPKTFNKKAYIKLQPVLKYNGNERPLKPLYLVGEKTKHDNSVRINYKKGGSFTYSDKTPYSDEMKHCVISLDYTVKIGSKYEELEQCISDTRDSIAKGAITTSLTVQATDDKYVKANHTPPVLEHKVTFYYVIDEGKLRDSVMKGPQIVKLRDAAKDSQFVIQKIFLRSFASPDGEMKRNGELVIQRAESAFKLTSREFKKLGVKSITDSNLLRSPDVNKEDWDGLKKLVMAGDMAGKNEVLAVINSSMSNDVKEDSLRKLKSWGELKTNYLPRLRRTEVVFVGTYPDRPLSILDQLVKSNQEDQLTQRELMLYANSLGEADTLLQGKLYKLYMRKYPTDWGGKNNYATLLIREGAAEYKRRPMQNPPKVVEAEAMLNDLATTVPGNDTILNNLAVAKRLNHKYSEAKDNYDAAAKAGMDESYNMMILSIKNGDYESATSIADTKLHGRNDYNVALAYTLKKDYTTAMNKIDSLDNKKAEDFYLKAIIAARSGNKDIMLNSLTRAVQMDKTLHDVALDDLEFRKYRNGEEFKAAIKVTQ